MVKTLQVVLVLFMGMAFGARMKEFPKHIIDQNDQTSSWNDKGGKEISRIFGGENADRDEYPWLIRLYYDGNFVCGGNILDEYTILTAAHCLTRDPDQRNAEFSIKAGDYRTFEEEASEQLRGVKQVILHERYNKKARYDRDVAILKLTDPLQFNKYVQTIRLADKRQEKSLFSTNQKCFAAGIGIKSKKKNYITSKTKEVRLQMQSRNACQRAFSTFFDGVLFTKYMVCSLTFLKATCSGDSGGPLMCYDEASKPFLVGITSFGSTKCWLGIMAYTRVSFLKAWIEKHLQ